MSRSLDKKVVRRFALWALALCLVASLGAGASADDRGQICLAPYADNDADGSRDADEAPLFGGVGASAIDQEGLTIATRLLADSPLAAMGLLCLDDLPAGDYRVLLTSSQYIATAAEVIAAAVAPGEPPARIEVGFRALFAPEPKDDAPTRLPDAHARENLVAAAIGIGVAVAILSLLGLVAIVVVIWRRPRRAGAGR